MNSTSTYLLFALIGLSPIASVRAEQNVDDRASTLIKKALEDRKKITTRTATVHLTLEVAGNKTTFAGKAYSMSPNKRRLDLEGGAGMTFLTDGRSTYMFIPSSNTFLRFPSRKSYTEVGKKTSLDDAAVFGDALDFSEYDNVRYVGTERIGGTNCDVIRGESKVSNCTVYIRPDLQVTRVMNEEVNSEGSTRVQFDYGDIVLNPPLEPSLFEFRPPPGAKEILLPSLSELDAKLIKVGKKAPRITISSAIEGTIDLPEISKGKKAVLVNFGSFG